MKDGIAGVRTDLSEAIKELRDNDLKHMEARVDRLDHRLTTGLGDVREEMRGFRAEVKAEVSDLRAEMGGLRSEMGGLRAEMNTAIHDIRADMRENHRQLLDAVQALPLAS
jgi:chromosome segregation ATPase